MHFHADHSLFFERRRPLWRATASLALTVGALVVNAGAGDLTVSLAGAGTGLGLLLVARVRGHQRIAPAVAWAVALVALVVLAGGLLSGDPTRVAQTGA
ncbi:MAG: hypothetical protein AAF211_34190, partial [Myxococcota bacterium]